MISLRLLTAAKIKLIGKLLLLGLKSGIAFYIESGTTNRYRRQWLHGLVKGTT